MRINRPRQEPEAPTPASPEGLDEFAASRGLPVEFLTAHGVHICPDDGPRPGWVTIPYPNLTGIWHYRYRNTTGEGPKYWAPPGSGTHLYNPQRLGPNTDTVVIAEGEFDTLVLTYLGYPAVGIPGASIAKSFERVSWRLLYSEAHVVIAFDGDEAGAAAANTLQQVFAPRVSVVELPEGQDVNDWFLDDAASLRYTVEQALKEGAL